MRLLITFLLVLSCSRAIARIGDTEDQIQARYGKPLTTLAGVGSVRPVAFLSGGFTILVFFENGVSRAEAFSKPDRAAITENEIQILLAANSGGFHWGGGYLDGETPVPGRQGWRSIDKRSRVAYYSEFDHSLFITSQEFLDHYGSLQKALDAAKLQKF